MQWLCVSVWSVSILLVGCSSDTSRHLITVGDAMRTAPVGAPLDANWAAPDYADQAWTSKVTAFDVEVAAMPADVTLRSRFDIGADYAAFRELTLTFAPRAP